MWSWRKRKPAWSPKYQSGDINYPDGTLVEVPAGRTWYIIKGKAFLVPTKRVQDSWAFPSHALTTQKNVDNFKVAGKLGFREGTLIRDMGDSKVYLISGNKRRQITDPDAFDKYGLNRDKIVEVSSDEALLHDSGEVLK